MWTFLLTASLLCWGSEATVSCKDATGGHVDWYIIYKAPRQDPLTGLEYLYIDSTGMNEHTDIKDPNGVLANTLKPIFTSIRLMPANFGFISYSDQPPGSKVHIHVFGHSKGVLMMDKTDVGVWLLHSTPQFPFRRDANHFWPETASRYAQTFICVTFNYQQFYDIGTHLQYIGAFPFEYDLPEDFHQTLRDAVNWNQLTPANNFKRMSSNGGHQFQIIAKQQNEQTKYGDLYVTIAQGLNSDVDVQTWCKKSPSYCEQSTPKVLNVKTVHTGHGRWPTTRDHSKWCVAKARDTFWTCIADVNRENTQYVRRGGALCIESREVRNIFLNFAEVTEDCPKHKHIKNIKDIIDLMKLVGIIDSVDNVGNLGNMSGPGL